jgi:fatty-acid peroxygenase
MVDGFGAAGLRHWQGRNARWTAEEWIRGVIRDVRSSRLNPPEGSAAREIAFHRELDGKLLDEAVAAVELLNILRPIVAIATYVTFGAHALYAHPEWREKLREGKREDVQLFVREIRRYYPFTPFVGAAVRKDFIWKGFRFPAGTLVLLDIYGMNHDPRYWDAPDVFRPERFDGRPKRPFDFMPQGGGDYARGHRCAGEWLTIRVMEESLRFLTRQMTYDVPIQDLSIDLSRIPTFPKDKMMMTDIRPLEGGSSSV